MLLYIAIAEVVLWSIWGYPFIFRAPHNQKRPSITKLGPTRIGLVLECLAITIAFVCRVPLNEAPALWRIVVSLACAAAATALSWGAVRHLGRQFRVHAGLYEDHELVTSGPYAIVRHPIYTSLLAMLVSTLVLITEWQCAVVALVLFVAGTEIRVRTEDGLLASRFGEKFFAYQKRVWAYVPFIR